MTHEHVTDFAQELVKMAMATTRVPQLEQDLSTAKADINGYLATIQRLELKLIDRAQQIETLQSTIRQLEVSRDDAELRFLECDDAKGTLVRVLEGLIGEAKGVLMAIAPVPEPTTAPVAEPTQPRDTFQGVKSEQDRIDDNLPPTWHTDIPLQDGPLSPPIGSEEWSKQYRAETETMNPFVNTEPQSSEGGPATASPSADAYSSEGTEGSVPVDPTANSQPNTTSSVINEDLSQTAEVMTVSKQIDASTEGVSVPSDPTVASPGSLTNSPASASSPPVAIPTDAALLDWMPF